MPTPELPPRAADPPLEGESEAAQAVERVLDAFAAESLPDGGIDAERSLWQAPGTGSASGTDVFPGGVDVRYLRFLAEALWRAGRLLDRPDFGEVAERHVRFMARSARPEWPTWALGNALEMIGLRQVFAPPEDSLTTAAQQVVTWLRQRRVPVTTLEGASFGHFPCGYGAAGARDAGWTNDLSMVGSGLVWSYELTGDESLLHDAADFAEYFLQPWRARALGPDGYWQCGTWHEGLGSWVIGPAHCTGFESTGAYGDEASWVFSTLTCIDFLARLHRHRPDPRCLDRCRRAAEWTFRSCQFEDGGVGMCGRDDEWLGLTGHAVSQVALLQPFFRHEPEVPRPLLHAARAARAYLSDQLVQARLEDHGVVWVTHQTSVDPLVNVGMLWASAAVGWLNGRLLR